MGAATEKSGCARGAARRSVSSYSHPLVFYVQVKRADAAAPFLLGHDDGVDEHARLQLYLVERREDAVFVAVGHGGLVDEYQQVDVGVCPCLAPRLAAVEAGVDGHGQRAQRPADGLCDVCPVHVETVLWVQSYDFIPRILHSSQRNVVCRRSFGLLPRAVPPNYTKNS